MTGEAFAALLTELGWKSDSRKALDELKQLNARLDIIINELMSIATEIQKSTYDIRSDELNKLIIAAKEYLESIAAYNDALTANMKDGQPIDPDKHKKLLDQMAILRNEIQYELKNALTLIHDRIMGIGSTTGLLKLYANVYLPRLVTYQYYDNLREHLEYWRSGQVLILGALTAGYADQDNPDYQLQTQRFQTYKESEKIQMPDNEVIVEYFGDDQTPEGYAFQAGAMIYDRKTQNLWLVDKPACSSRMSGINQIASSLYGFRPNVYLDWDDLRDAIGPYQGKTFYQVMTGMHINMKQEQTWFLNTFYPQGVIAYFTATDGPEKSSVELEKDFYPKLDKRPSGLNQLCAFLIYHMPPGKYKYEPGKGFIPVK